MKKRFIVLFICLISVATGVGLTVTKIIDPNNAFSMVKPAYTLLARSMRRLFPIKVYPGELIMTVAESTGALAPEYFRRYTYTYKADYDGNSYTQDNADFIQQKKITTNLMGGHDSLELSIAKNAPADVFICIFKNSFDSQNVMVKSEWIGSFKTTE